VDSVEAAQPAAVDLVGLTRSLVDIDSTTGREAEAGLWLARYLRAIGFAVTEQRVDDTRFNIMASSGTPAVVLTTHFDCVPPFFPSRLEGGRLFGRGACDAKGILAAQVAAADVLRRQSETRVGLLFVVGEERGSDGARAANLAPKAAGSSSTASRPRAVSGSPRGILRVRLRATGRCALVISRTGRVGIDKLIDALVELRSIALPADPVLVLRITRSD
jgi:acetylornithine deacetylase